MIENMADEIFDSIKESYSDDRKLYGMILIYLYKQSTDEKLLNKLLKEMDKYNICNNCGSLLEYVSYLEKHKELEGNYYEYLGDYICPYCGY